VRSRPWLLVGSVLAFACAAGLIASRTFNSIASPGLVNGRLADFRDAVYYPVRAVLDGHNPYDTPHYMALYPAVGQDFPLYTPAHLLFFLPFAALSFEAARAVHFALSVALLFYLARLSMLWVGRREWWPTFLLAAFVIVSFPGRVVLQTGQTTALTAVGVWFAWRYRKETVVSGLGLAVAMFKPVIGVPVAAVFVVARYVKNAVAAVIITAVAVLPVLIACVIASGGIRGFVDSIGRNLDYTDQSSRMLPRTGGSTDVVSLFARIFHVSISTTAWFLISIPVFVVVLYVLVRCRPFAQGLDLLSLGVVGVLLVGYQPVYHGVLLVPVVCWLSLGPVRDIRGRWVVFGLLGWLFVTPFATDRFHNSLRPGSPLKVLGASTSCMCLLVSFVIFAYGITARRNAPRPLAIDVASSERSVA
jgi:hypothetical protein